VPPHPSEIVPHCPAPHFLGVQHEPLPKHTWSALGQEPHVMVPPHPSLCEPHLPAVHVFGTQHLPLMHASLFGHVGAQFSVPPHP